MTTPTAADRERARELIRRIMDYPDSAPPFVLGNTDAKDGINFVAQTLSDCRERDAGIALAQHDDDGGSVDECECGACLAAQAIREDRT